MKILLLSVSSTARLRTSVTVCVHGNINVLLLLLD